MDGLESFEEIAADETHREIVIPVMDVTIFLNASYFINRAGIGFCSLLIKDVRGKGLKGIIEAAVGKAYVG